MFRWADRFYNPLGLLRYDIKDVRKEYTRLRNQLKKKLTALRKAGYRKSEYVRRAARLGRVAQKHLSDDEVRSQLSDIHREMIKPWLTPEGMAEHRSRTIEGLHNYGYEFVNEKNLDDFEKFMEEFKGTAVALQYNSDQVAEMYELIRERDITNASFKKYFDAYMKGQNELERTKPGKRSGYYNRIVREAANIKES